VDVGTTDGGVLGAGKTTLANRLLRNPGDRDVAVVVNDVGEVNVDAELVERTEEGIVDLSNGCICCRLQGDLLTSLERLADEREFDALVVEASGISEPVPITRTLTTGDDGGASHGGSADGHDHSHGDRPAPRPTASSRRPTAASDRSTPSASTRGSTTGTGAPSARRGSAG
jgi:hypothetical protein